ncbi:MAG: rhodanese-like domain-containing protein [Candidatus Latescibacterota bacterium]|jgi:sodium/bile acid cotransporter 7
MIGRKAVLWIYLTSVILSAPPATAGDDPLTDGEKKAVVYDMYQSYKNKDFPEVSDISAEELMSLASLGDVIVVDTREAGEMEVSMLPGAITRQDFLENLNRYREKTIVAYCTISYRSGKFAKEMKTRGVTVLNLRGGILAWALEGGRVYDEEGKTRRIHVYGDEWNYVPAGYEAITFSLLERLF